MKKRILLIEDDIDIGDLIQSSLTEAGYQIKRAYSGTEGLLLINQNSFDLILLDLMLPGINGEEIVNQIGMNIPIIIVSAKAGLDDKVNNLLNGAVDYITKPFYSEELLARVQVHLRQPTAKNNVYSFGHICVDNDLNTAFADGKPLKLTKTEYAVLKILIKSPKRIYPKTQLADLVSENAHEVWETALNVHIHNLRKKIYDACGVYYIETIWGMGFRFYDEKS